MMLQVALAVQQEVEARFAETDALRRKHVERAQYEAELARRRYIMSTLITVLLSIVSKRNGTTSSVLLPRRRDSTSSRRRNSASWLILR